MTGLRKAPFLRDVWAETVEYLDDLTKALSDAATKAKMLKALTTRIAAKRIKKPAPRSAVHATEADDSSDDDT
jgi:hypothetical protein